MGILAHYSALPHSPQAGISTTLDLTQPANVVLVQNVLASDDGTTWEMPPDAPFKVSDLIFHFVEKIDPKTGEDVSGPMMSMVGPDGVYHSGSQYAYRDLQRIALLRGMPPWHPPIVVRAVRSRSRNGKDYQSLMLVE